MFRHLGCPLHVGLLKADVASHEKPTGINGPVLITGGGPPPQFQAVPFPRSKPEMEAAILRGALKFSAGMEKPFYSLAGEPVQNKENDLDFQLPTASGTQHLDLAEIVHSMTRGGYEGAPSKFRVGDMVDNVWGVIQAKEKKYGARRRLVIHLLLYSVDWKFFLSESCIALLRLYCQRRKQHFASIAYYAPITLDEGILWPLSPIDSMSLPHIDEASLRNNVVTHGNPAAIEATPDGMGAILRLDK